MLTSRTTLFSRLSAALAVLALSAALPASAQTTTFNFAADTGKTTTFTDTVGGLSATFSSPFDPYIFAVQSSYFSNIAGNILGLGQAGANNVPLDIALSASQSKVSLNFGLNGFDTSTLTITAYSGGLTGTKIGSQNATGSIPGGEFLFPEGSVQFASASPFDTLEITSTAQNLAVGNIQLSAPGNAPVPEAPTPVSLGLLLVLGSATIILRRKKALAA